MEQQLLTANVATNLLWLGRHLERVENSLIKLIKAYDDVIDVDKDAGVTLFKKYGIDLKYTNALDFLENAISGEHPANLFNIMTTARENAIICRSQIDADAFGEIIALHALFENISKHSHSFDYKLIDTALSLINEIWGSLSKNEHRKSSDCFFRLGKLIEELDFHLRFDAEQTIVTMVIHDIDEILDLLSSNTEAEQKQSQRQTSEKKDIMDEIHKKVSKIIIG